MTDIKLKAGEVGILKAIAHGPRTLHAFTHAANSVADVQLAPNTVRQYIDHLVELGFIAAPARQNGHYCICEAGLEYLAAIPAVVPAVLVCAASMPPGSYRPKPWFVRAGGEMHRQFRSRGLG
jgi:DNA-binding IclR family transcriptional regulator